MRLRSFFLLPLFREASPCCCICSTIGRKPPKDRRPMRTVPYISWAVACVNREGVCSLPSSSSPGPNMSTSSCSVSSVVDGGSSSLGAAREDCNCRGSTAVRCMNRIFLVPLDSFLTDGCDGLLLAAMPSSPTPAAVVDVDAFESFFLFGFSVPGFHMIENISGSADKRKEKEPTC